VGAGAANDGADAGATPCGDDIVASFVAVGFAVVASNDVVNVASLADGTYVTAIVAAIVAVVASVGANVANDNDNGDNDDDIYFRLG
jgi:hypothetical protein